MLNCVLKMKLLNAALLRSLLLLLLALPTISFSQSYSGYNWYFGNSTNGIRFSRSDRSATFVNNHVNLGEGGGAVASDAINGNLLFYTDGNTIYDRNHTIMGPPPNGTGLAGNTAGNQAVAIAKVPGQDNQYYVFVNTANGTTAGAISYRIVDMSLGGTFGGPPPVGQVTTAANTALALPLTTSEAMMIIPHPDGDDFWLITHANGTPDYVVTRFTPSGPTTTTTFTGLGLIEVAENFSYHPASNRIAVSPQEGNRDVEIVNFDPATGGLTFQQRVLNSGVASAPTNPAVYDTEWSHNGQYLYISRSSQAGAPPAAADVLQYDLNNPSTTLASIIPPGLDITNSYGLQMAPDSTIYHLYTTSAGPEILLGQISDTDSVASLVQYNGDPLGNGEDFNGKQFPSFAPRDTVAITLTFTTNTPPLCSNSPVSFFPTVAPGADSLRWDFGDGSSSSEWSPVYTYENGGTFTVTVTAFLNGQTQTFQQSITVTEFDTQISLVQDTTGCSENFPFPKDETATGCGASGEPCFTVTAQVNGSGSPDLQWFGPSGLLTGEKSATLAPDSAGYYYLVATDMSTGCSTYAGVNIKEYLIEDQRANIWYFGNNAGIDFNPLPDDPAVAISNTVMNAPEGTATISDRNGQVIFFTDGDKVWNRANTEVATGIGGEPGSTQSAIIIPVPGDETLYYIFTTKQVESGIYEVRYSLFDLRLNGGSGGLKEQNVLLFAHSTERLTGNGNWLIAHEFGNNSFRAYRITAEGIGNPVISGIGSDHSFVPPTNGQGYMKLGSQNRLAVALSGNGSNVIEVFDFADSTGIVSNFRTADLNSPTGQVYGVEFSPGGNKLYATLQDVPPGSSQLVEFAFDTLSNPYLKKPPIAPVTEKLGAIQTGPDGQLYVAVDGEQFLGTIQVVEDTTQVSTFTLNGFGLDAGTNSTLGLPNFIQTLADPIQSPGITATGLCLTDTTMFTASGKDSSIDKFTWSFGDGAGAVDAGPEQTHVYAAAGTYTVVVTVFNECETYDITRTITINAKPPVRYVPETICGPVLPTLDANPTNLPGLTYVWSTGDSTKTIIADRQAQYTVTVTNASGCSSVSEFLVNDNRPILNLGPNTTICQNTPIAPLDAQNPTSGNTYAWTLSTNNGAPVALGSSRTQSVNTNSAGVFEYEVTVTSGLCVRKDSVIYTINPSPTFNALPSPTSACNANDGQINLTITGPTSSVFSYFVTGPTTVPSSSGTDRVANVPIAVPPVPGLAPGAYGVTVADQVSGCATIDVVTINDPAFTAAGSQIGTCDPLAIEVTTTAGAIYPINYRVINTATSVQMASGTATAGPFTTPGVPSGDYIVELTATGGCVTSTPVVPLQQDTPLAITFDTDDICTTNSLTAVTSPGATSFDWSQSVVGSLVTPGATTATVAINPGQWLMTVVADDGPGGACPGTASTTVLIDNYTPAFTQTDACQDQVTLTATPSGSYTYRWFRNNVFIPGGRQITATAADDNLPYFVQVVSTLNGCIKPSPAATVQVDGALNVTLVTTPPCEGSPFTLTATPSRTPVTYQWTLDGSLFAGQTTSTLQGDRAGTYAVTATAATCTATSSLPIILNPLTAGLLRETARICPDPANPDPNSRVAILDPGDDADFLSYDWFKDGVSLGVTDPTFTADEPGLFSVNLINVFGCASSDKTEVVVECDPVIVGPNAFRPSSALNVGGEMVNQSFKLFTFFIDDEDFQVFIFNRWGEMIFQSPERDFKWNGGYNNNLSQIAPPGTYSYVVRYKSSYRPEEGIKEKRGGVVLMR